MKLLESTWARMVTVRKLSILISAVYEDEPVIGCQEALIQFPFDSNAFLTTGLKSRGASPRSSTLVQAADTTRNMSTMRCCLFIAVILMLEE